jgi:hypothetical protein
MRKKYSAHALFFAFLFAFETTLPAQNILSALPLPTQLLDTSEKYSLPVLKGICFNPTDPLKIEFIINTADQKTVDPNEAALLIRYFLAGLTIPEEEVWVNLSPYEKNRIISDNLAATELGSNMLAQDYLLKQLASSLTCPENTDGKNYWNVIYKTLGSKTAVNAFNKVWIMPDKANVYEKGNNAIVTEATLKAISQEDYLALNDNVITDANTPPYGHVADRVNQIAAQAMREKILPRINYEVNYGKNFAQLRQMYNSLILAIWFKQRFKNSFYKYYIAQSRVDGIALSDVGDKDAIYNCYVEAYKKGVYNKIRKSFDPLTSRITKRSYHCGGVIGPRTKNVKVVDSLPTGINKAAMLAQSIGNNAVKVTSEVIKVDDELALDQVPPNKSDVDEQTAIAQVIADSNTKPRKSLPIYGQADRALQEAAFYLDHIDYDNSDIPEMPAEHPRSYVVHNITPVMLRCQLCCVPLKTSMISRKSKNLTQHN